MLFRSDGVDISGSRFGADWRLERVHPPSRMRSGDWVIWDPKQGDERFFLYLILDERTGDSVDIDCRRLAADRFEVIEITLGEWVNLKKS